ncbi:hypothetical protein BDZ94DRAFT_915803 [Collybia nuda]|uniref:Uncharacterized protein n=1 Tax=Collybia nuda TaxID=64659 RepID=A0A9P5YHH6_9AGAR|nr:hypothetical protein BDZ94DRAFT_915803 [Collybia nuda]
MYRYQEDLNIHIIPNTSALTVIQEYCISACQPFKLQRFSAQLRDGERLPPCTLPAPSVWAINNLGATRQRAGSELDTIIDGWPRDWFVHAYRSHGLGYCRTSCHP